MTKDYSEKDCPNFYYRYKDNSDGKWLTIKVYVESAFNPVEFAYDDDDALKVYKILVSNDREAITKFIIDDLLKSVYPKIKHDIGVKKQWI
jgi:hypothetical protein